MIGQEILAAPITLCIIIKRYKMAVDLIKLSPDSFRTIFLRKIKCNIRSDYSND